MFDPRGGVRLTSARLGLVLSLIASTLLAPSLARAQSTSAPAVSGYGRLPLAFEANQGQSDASVRFLARGRGYGLFLTSTEAVLALTAPDGARARGRGQTGGPRDASVPAVIRMRMVDADPDAMVTGLDPLPGRTHYLIGTDARAWRRNVPTFARVEYRDVYPGIDLVYYGNQRQLEYDFVVRPGGDPARVALDFDGARALTLDAAGHLVIATAAGDVTLRRPDLYQEVAGVRTPIDGGYVVEGRRVRFRVAAYDASRPLVIDPVLVYSTYLGGVANDEAFGIAVDATANVYVTGSTISPDFPVTLAPFQAVKSLGTDAFVVKIDPTGTNLLYATYLGGSGADAGNAIAVDASGNAHVAGSTVSNDFPTQGAPPQTGRGALSDAFLTKLDASGGVLVYSMYLGGNADDFAFGVAVDTAGQAYVTGSTASTDFPTFPAPPFDATKGAGTDAFVTKVGLTGALLVYSTYLGGQGEDTGNAIATDTSGNAYVVGTTTSTDFPRQAPMQPTRGGAADAFVTKLAPNGLSLVFSTYLGGLQSDEGLGVAVSTDRSVYVTGATASPNFPHVGAAQVAIGGLDDAFVAKLSSSGSALSYSTFLGGAGDDVGNAIAVHTDGSAYVTGLTRSADFPVVAGIQGALGGGADAFLTKVTAPGNAFVYSTYLGGAGDDEGNAVAVDVDGNAYLAGATNSVGFPTVTPLQGLAGGTDAFVAMVADGGILQFSGAQFTVAETAGTATITVQRTGDISSAVTVNFATADGTASAGADYLGASGTLVFAPGQTSATFTVTVLNDGIGDGDETVHLTLSTPIGGAVLGGRRTATLRIVDDEPSINFSAVSFALVEGAAPSATVTVTRSGSTVGTVTVQFATSDGTATTPADYAATTRTLTFAPGVTTQSVPVPIVNDTLSEGTETVNLTLSGVIGGTPAAQLGVRNTAVVTIVDNDVAGVVQFSTATYQVSESAAQAVIAVSRTGGAASGVTVDYATSNGSATAGGDYVPSSGTLTFAAGQNTVNFTVPILNDTTAEGDETVNLTLTTPGGGATIGTRNTAVLKIVDDEPTVSFTTNAFTVSEGGVATISVRRGGVATGAATVDYTTSDGSAVAGVHYTPVSGTLSFASGATLRTFTVPILDDTSVAANRSLQLTLSNPTGPVTVVAPSQATLTIIDDDVAGALDFSATTYTALENVGTALITVTRSGGTASGVTVNFNTADGTAGGLDYVGNAGTLTFGAGETSKTFTVQLTDDNVAEGVETVNLALSAPGGGGALGTRSNAVLRIVDDELTFRFSAAAYTVSEGAGVATITVERTGTSAGNVGIEFATSNGTAVAGQDYTATSGTLTFAPGVTTRTFTVPILQDTLADGAKTFNMTLLNPFPPAAQVVASQSAAVVNITDDDTGGTVQFASATFTGAEGTPSAVVTVRRTLGAASGVTVDYATSNGTATAGLDYTATSGTLTFAAGQTSLTFTVPILNDAVGEGAETVNLTLSNPAGGAVLGGIAAAVLSITDDEPHVRFSAATYAVSEGAGNAVITVQRGGDPSVTVTVDFATADVLPPGSGTAGAGVDYTANAGTLTFAPGVLTRTFPVAILSDSLIESAETVELRLSNPTVSAGTVTLVSPATAVLTIDENDVGGIIQFSAAGYTVNETAGQAVITIVRSGGTAEATIQFETGFVPPAPGVAETATAGVDYTTTTGTVIFGVGQTTKSVIIPILDDATAEGTETINLRLFNPGPTGAPGSPALGPQATAVVKIVDDEQAVQFTAATFTVLEGLPVATITVERAGTAGTVTVDYATSDPLPAGPGNARAGFDYQGTAGTLTFGPGVNVNFFTIPIIDNTPVEAPKAVNLTLSNAVGATLAPQSTAVLTIKENDRGGIFSITGGSIVENQGVFTVTVSRTDGAASGVTVDYAAAQCGTVVGAVVVDPCDFPASPVTHFQPVSGTLTFNAGETSKTFTVNVIDNNFPQGSRNVGLAVGNPLPTGIMQDSVDVGATLGASQALLNIVEDELHFVNLSAETYTVGEGVGAATITVVRSGLPTLLAGSFTVDVTATGLTAIPGQDFNPVSTSLVFGPNVTTRTFTVPILEDTIVDGERSVLVQITAVTPVSTAGGPGRTFPQAAVLSITDNDVAGVLQFIGPTFAVNENVASGLATVTVSRTGGVAGEVAVDYETVPPPVPALVEMATDGVDYTASSGTVVFAAGETTKTFTVPVADDAADEGVESVNLRLLNPRLLNPPVTGPAPTLGTQVTAVLRIVDDEQTVHFARSNYDVNEAAGLVTVLVERTSTAAGLTVDYSTSDNTALAGSEYTAVSGTLTFGAGQAAASFTVPILDNATVTADRTFNVHLAAQSAGVLPVGRDTSTVTIKDDDRGGQVAVGAASFSVLENVGTATITIARSGGNAGGVTIDYATSDGTAVAGLDYTPAAGTVTFAAGEFVQTISVTILDDGTSESREQLTITLSNPQPAGLGPRSPTLGTATATLFILDDEADFRLGATAYSASEGAVVATVTVLRGGSLTGTHTVDITASDQLPAGPGRAVAGQDYTGGTPVTLTFTPGVASMTFDVPIANDTIVEPDETLDLALSNPSAGATLGTPVSAVLTILDNDVGGTLQFSAPTFTVNENGVAATITVTRVGGAASGITVDYATADGGATTAGGDYTAASGTLTFGAGETSKTFAVTINDDATGEGVETVNLFLTAATGGAAIGEPSVAVLRITDDDNSVQFTAATYVVSEHAGVASITVQRTGTVGTVTVNYATADGSATAPTDYAGAAGTLTFPPGVFTQTFMVPIVNDNALEGPETITLTLSGVSGGTLVLNTATLLVQDNDFAGVIEFTAAFYDVAENGGSAVITLSRVGGTAGGVTVDYATSDGTATGGGVDYVTQTGTLTFNPGETSKTFAVAVVNDLTSEAVETVNLAISNPQPVGLSGSPVLGLRQNAVLRITDDEPVLRFLAPNVLAQEWAGPVTVTVVRGGDTSVQATVDYATSDGTATVAGGDYTASSGTLTFAPGVTTRTFTVTIVDDQVEEGVETVTLQLSNPQPAGQVGAGPLAVLTINDDDVAGRIQFNAAHYTVTEGIGSATITVTRTGGAAGPVTIDYATANGTATVASGDYTAASGTLTFNPGQTAATFQVTINDDLLAEGEETVILSLANPQAGALLGTPTQATLRIGDNEPTLRFSAPNYAVTENGGLVTVTVQRLGSTAGTATVDYATSDGTASGAAVAAPGVDYLTRAGTLTFGPGVASRTFTVPIVNDTAVEGNETINLALSGETGATIVSAADAVAQITVINDDFRGAVQFTSATYTVLESGTNAAVTLTRTGGVGGPVTVQFETLDGGGSAVAGADYGSTVRTVTFAANQAMATVMVPIVNDGLDEPDETILLRLVPDPAPTAPTVSADIGARDTATLTITDNDVAGVVQFSAAVYTIAENAPAPRRLTVTVTRTGGIAGGVTVDYATVDGPAPTGATAGTDYVAAAGTLTFNASQASASFTIDLGPDDALAEGIENIVLVLSNVQGGATLGTRATALARIVDDESTVQLGAVSYSVLEGSTLTVTVERTGSTNPVTVNFATSDASAVGGAVAGPGIDYLARSGTLTFTTGVMTRTFTVPTVTNVSETGNRTFNVTLGGAAGATLGGAGAAVATIVENDEGGRIHFSAPAYSIPEHGGVVTIQVSRTGGAAAPVTVDYATSDGTATAGIDYTARAGTLTFPAGQTLASFTVPIISDTVEEGARNFNVTLTNPTGGAIVDAPSTAVVNIVDNDEGGVIQFSATTFNASECAALPCNALVTILRKGGTAGGVTVDLTTSDGTATAGVDYVPTTTTVVLASGQLGKVVPIPLLIEPGAQAPKTFNVTLSNPRGGAAVGVITTTVVRITDLR